MLGATHVAAGAAVGIFFAQPSTVSECLLAAGAGALGGYVCDVDINSSAGDGSLSGLALLGGAITVIAMIDKGLGGQLATLLLARPLPALILGIAGLVALCLMGIASSHRTFTHSILGTLLFTFSVWIACPEAATPFGAGMASHVALDLLNKKDVNLFYPSSIGFCLGLAPANGRANDILFPLASLAAVGQTMWRLSTSQQNGLLPGMDLSFLKVETIYGLPLFWAYLLAINLFTFLVYTADFFLTLHETLEDDDYRHNFLSLLGLAGGGVGMLLALVIWSGRVVKGNATWYVSAVAFTMLWGVLIFAFLAESPNTTTQIAPVESSDAIAANDSSDELSLAETEEEATASPREDRTRDNVPDLSMRQICYLVAFGLYLLAVNLAALGLFTKDSDNRHTTLDGGEFLLVLVAIAGGAPAGWLVTTFTGGKAHSPHFAFGLPILSIVWAIAAVVIFRYIAAS